MLGTMEVPTTSQLKTALAYVCANREAAHDFNLKSLYVHILAVMDIINGHSEEEGDEDA